MSDHYFMDNLQLPGARAISALSYYHSETWPKIAQMITTHLSNQNASCSVAPMIEVGDEEFFKPWIIVRVIPAERNPGMPLDHEIKNLMIENGYLDPQYNVHIESGKCAARSITTKAFARDFKMFDGYNYNGGGGTTAHGGRNFYGRKHNNSSGKIIPNLQTKSPITDIFFSPPAFTARSVKHLTCWYWLHSQAGCNKTDDSCLYSHSDTGRYADQPRPAFPGGKAIYQFLSY